MISLNVTVCSGVIAFPQERHRGLYALGGKLDLQQVWIRSLEGNCVLSGEKLFSHAFYLLLTTIKSKISKTFTIH